jgi:hypothetical protein
VTATLTLDGWLETRSESVPDELRERIRALVRDVADHPVNINALADIAKTQLQTLFERGLTSRDVALDLLAVDAIATYALEIAASRRDNLDASAANLLHAIASLMESQEPNP